MKPFRSSNQAKVVAVTAASQAVAIPSGVGTSFRAVTADADCYIRWGTDNTVAATTADGGFDIMIPAGAVEIGGFPATATYFAVIGGASGTLQFTKGEAA